MRDIEFLLKFIQLNQNRSLVSSSDTFLERGEIRVLPLGECET